MNLNFLKIAVFSINIFWWKWYSKISRWYARKLFQQIVSVIVQLNPNKHDFQKQPFTNDLQNRCSWNFAKFTWKHFRPVTLLKTDSNAGVLLHGYCFWIFSFALLFFTTQCTTRNQVFSIFEHVWLSFEREE